MISSTFLSEKPVLRQFLWQLHASGARWTICSGTQVALLTSQRLTADVDIMVHDDDFELVASLLPTASRKDNQHFPITTTSGEELSCVASKLSDYIDGVEIDIVSHARFHTSEGDFYTNLSEFAYDHRIERRIAGMNIPLSNPFDTILIKAFMRRGHEQNKHDLADSKALSMHLQLDEDYIEERIKETNLSTGARLFLQEIGVLIPALA